MVRVVDGGDTATTLDALMIMFKELAGAPKKITSDNPKAFVIDASKYESKLNTVLSL